MKPCLQSPILLLEIKHPSLKTPNCLLKGFIVIVSAVMPMESLIYKPCLVSTLQDLTNI
jgi:hypothetical protein